MKTVIHAEQRTACDIVHPTEIVVQITTTPVQNETRNRYPKIIFIFFEIRSPQANDTAIIAQCLRSAVVHCLKGTLLEFNKDQR